METLNYNLSGGNKTLITKQAMARDMVFQCWYTGIVATDVRIDVYVSTDKDQPFKKVEGAEKTLGPANGTEYISLSGLAFMYVQFRLVVGSAVVGTITKIDVLA